MTNLRAAMRNRTQKELSEHVIMVGDLTVDLAAYEVFVSDRPVTLTPTEHELLRVLARNVGRVVTHKQGSRRCGGSLITMTRTWSESPSVISE